VLRPETDTNRIELARGSIMANEFMDRLRNTDDVLVCFNAIQTIFTEEYGKPMGEHLSAWIIDHPKEYQDTLQRIYAAGHDISHIGTQAASIFRAKPFGQAIIDRIHELNYKPAKLVKEVTPKGHYAIGLVSTSLQDFLEPLGNITREEVYTGYLEQIKGLVDGGIDVIAIVGDDVEAAVIATKALKDHYPDVPVINRSLFYTGKKGFRTLMGLDPKTVATKFHEAGAEVIGFSCGLMNKSEDASQYYPSATNLIKELRQGTDRYLIALPNAGLARLVNDETVYPATPEMMAKEVLNWVDAGARIVGGCCGTSIEHGRMTAAVLKKRRAKGL
jgi:5-methyltetrahydrofolate--homocysteine methyltransferase